jgi:pyridoxine 5'-phosphate synthase PdxJ
MDAIQRAAEVLAQLLQVKCDEDRRHADQRTIRDLSKLHREFRGGI